MKKRIPVEFNYWIGKYVKVFWKYNIAIVNLVKTFVLVCSVILRNYLKFTMLLFLLNFCNFFTKPLKFLLNDSKAYVKFNNYFLPVKVVYLDSLKL